LRIAEADILILPGIGDTDAGHWQRRWAERFSTGRIVEPADRERPKLQDWSAALQQEIVMSTRPVVLIAHGLAVSAVVHTAQRLVDTKVRGAFLVSPLDHEGDRVPSELKGFGRVPRDPLPFPSLLVVSSNDPLCSIERAVDMATCWGSEIHIAANAGHIDAASGHGPWPEGLLMFTRLMQRLKA
jgi:predicted alpha/beta hydrolase family esterase